MNNLLNHFIFLLNFGAYSQFCKLERSTSNSLCKLINIYKVAFGLWFLNADIDVQRQQLVNFSLSNSCDQSVYVELFVHTNAVKSFWHKSDLDS